MSVRVRAAESRLALWFDVSLGVYSSESGETQVRVAAVRHKARCPICTTWVAGSGARVERPRRRGRGLLNSGSLVGMSVVARTVGGKPCLARYKKSPVVEE